jgi:hypothetical protein
LHKNIPLAVGKRDIFIRRSLFSSANSLVETVNQGIYIDAVSHSALLDILEMSGSAAKAAHAGIYEYVNRIRVFLYNVKDTHVFRDSHSIKTSCVKNHNQINNR